MWTIIAIVVLVLAGAALLAAEIFVLPGVTMPGVIGGACLVGGIGWAFYGLGPSAGGMALGAGAVATVGLGVVLSKSQLAKKMVLETQHSSRVTDGTELPQVGREGTARTPLRPSGTATFGDLRIDVVTQGTYVEAGARVRVVAVNGARVVVAPMAEG